MFGQHILRARKGQTGPQSSLVHPAVMYGSSLFGEQVLSPCFGTSPSLGCHLLYSGRLSAVHKYVQTRGAEAVGCRRRAMYSSQLHELS